MRVIAGMIPLDLLANEAGSPPEKGLYRRWQQQWDNSEKGHWTHTLIPCIERWVKRKHGKLNYDLTQFLPGHGEYRKNLHRFGLD